jgi:hypothetical protein
LVQQERPIDLAGQRFDVGTADACMREVRLPSGKDFADPLHLIGGRVLVESELLTLGQCVFYRRVRS